jgi:hypothetical protein
MIYVCSVCHRVKLSSIYVDASPDQVAEILAHPEIVSHGLCPKCEAEFREREGIEKKAIPTMLLPLPSPTDCYDCRHADRDSDGVPQGCQVEKCIRPDRRGPGGDR